MNSLQLTHNEKKGFNIFIIVTVSSFLFIFLNLFLYQIRTNIEYFPFFIFLFLLFNTFYMIYITQKNSTNKSGFYYYTSIGFSFMFFGLLIHTFGYVFIYKELMHEIIVNLLLAFGYTLLAIGVTKWVKYNESRQEELSKQASTDELTGLLNRRSFTQLVNYEFENARRNSEPFSLAIIDLDHFKSVNDEHGHLIGDEVLKDLAIQMKDFFRKFDSACRWGGEEFAVLLPQTSLSNGTTTIDKFRKIVEEKGLLTKSVDIKYTLSAGISESLTTDTGVDDIIRRADEALYLAKNKRNSVRSVRK